MTQHDSQYRAPFKVGKGFLIGSFLLFLAFVIWSFVPSESEDYYATAQQYQDQVAVRLVMVGEALPPSLSFASKMLIDTGIGLTQEPAAARQILEGDESFNPQLLEFLPSWFALKLGGIAPEISESQALNTLWFIGAIVSVLFFCIGFGVIQLFFLEGWLKDALSHKLYPREHLVLDASEIEEGKQDELILGQAWFELVLYYIFSFALGFIIGVLVKPVVTLLGVDGSSWLLFVYTSIVLGSVFLLKRYVWSDWAWKQAWGDRSYSVSFCFWQGLRFGTLAFIANLIVQLLLYNLFETNIPSSNPILEEFQEEGSLWAFTAMFFMACIIAPLVEELIFRGFLFGRLRQVLSFPLAALLSAFIFSVIHFDPGATVSLVVVGIVFALAYEVHQSLWVNIVAHSVFNSITFIMLAFYLL